MKLGKLEKKAIYGVGLNKNIDFDALLGHVRDILQTYVHCSCIIGATSNLTKIKVIKNYLLCFTKNSWLTPNPIAINFSH